ncbi:MAG: hypothetical protein QNK29_03885 [Desulfobacterales bacterium]|nr:hypothetical protein [Desulfobacterales bacterium]MDX2511120.1 hypothetical protein [Desulfobacterales bacterium]
MRNREGIRIGWLNLILGSMVFLWACSQTIEPANSQGSTTKETSMSNVHEKGRPPIDTAVPEIFETASFGLG